MISNMAAVTKGKLILMIIVGHTRRSSSQAALLSPLSKPITDFMNEQIQAGRRCLERNSNVALAVGAVNFAIRFRAGDK